MTNGALDLIRTMTMNSVGAIKSLFSKWNPCTVFWTIISIYINALNRKVILVIGLLNPFGKINIIIPFFANLYASTAIVFVSKIIRILATLSHSLPYFINPRVRLAMLCEGCSAPARAAIKALIALISSAPKNLAASFANKIKIGSMFILIHCPIIQRLG